ncbi:ribosome-binding protein 1a [Neosynchiropus ocellatus]
MDIYDPQTLGIMVFGGFMVISAVGIALVSTLSMKETSYEEALAKQRMEMGRIQSARAEKKKKEKVSEKKSRGKKKEDKPNGKIPEPESNEKTADADEVIEPAVAPSTASAVESAPVVEVKPTTTRAETQQAAPPSPPLADPSPAPSPKEKKKKKTAKVEPAVIAAPAPAKSSTAPTSAKTSLPTKAVAPVSAPAQCKAAPTVTKTLPAPAKATPVAAKSTPPPIKSAPAATKPTKSAPAKSDPAPSKSAPATSKPAPAPAKSSPASPKKAASTKQVAAPGPASAKQTASVAPEKQAPSSAPASTKQAAASTKQAPASAKQAPASAKQAPASAKQAPSSTPASTKQAPSSAPASTKQAPSAAPASTKSAKSAPVKGSAVQAKSAAAPAKSAPAQSKSAPVLESVTKDVPVMAVPPVGAKQNAPLATKAQESKKKGSKKNKENVPSVNSAEAPLYLPYKSLVSTLRSMVFSEGEAHKLIEILSEKSGIIQGQWQTATQKGDPVVMLKKQLEEREKQLAAEQEDAAAAKNRLREVTKELNTEKSKVASVETRLSSQLSKREQEIIALQARMQASYQDHVSQTQSLNAKIHNLQDQLEKGPNAQLARLQQENSILRDALNQATSQAESKQNAELAKLRQECAKLTKELGEKTEGLHADEIIRKELEAKVSAVEKQLSIQQASHSDSEKALQRKLEEVCEELRATQTKNSGLHEALNNAQQESSNLSEYQVCVEKLETEAKQHSAQVEALNAQLKEAEEEKSQLVQQMASINALLEANQSKQEDSQANVAELEKLRLGIQDRDTQLSALQEDLKQLQMKQASERTVAELAQQNKSEDTSLVATLQDELKVVKEEMTQLKNAPQTDFSAEREQLQKSLNEKDDLVTQLQDKLKEANEKMTNEENIVAQMKAFQSEVKETFQTLFPQITIETAQPNWLQDVAQEAQESLVQQNQVSQSSTEVPELLTKLKEAEDSHSTLQAECEQYRTVLAETEGMLKHLQKSVEEEEQVWRSKMADTEEQLRAAVEKTQALEAENKSIGQMKEQMMLLEAQLEKQADEQIASEQLEQLKQQLMESQSQLASAQKEAQEHKEELSQVKEQLGEVSKTGPQEQNGPTEAQSSQVHMELNQTSEKMHGEAGQRMKLSEELEQAQTTISELQAQLDLLKVSTESPQGDTEDVAQLKERLEKEKKLSKDLGQAATKLQQLLKATQEQLTKERDTVKTLQEHLGGKGDFAELKEGTSV